MIAESQGAPFLLNFDERAIAGLLREARMSGKEVLSIRIMFGIMRLSVVWKTRWSVMTAPVQLISMSICIRL